MNPAQAVEGGGDVGVFRALNLAADGQRLAAGRDGPVEVAAVLVDAGQEIETFGDPEGFGSLLAAEGQGLLVPALRCGVVLAVVREVAKNVQGPGNLGVVGAEDLAANGQCLPVVLQGPVVLERCAKAQARSCKALATAASSSPLASLRRTAKTCR